MSYPYLLTLLGVILFVTSMMERGWALVAVWLGCNFLILGVAHWQGYHGVFGKRTDGTLPVWSWILFFPLHVYTLALWHFVRLFSKEPAFNIICDELVVGRRLFGFENVGEFDNYVDLTAEFSEPAAVRRSPAYRSVPILDGAAPAPEVLRAVVTNLRPGRTFIHCAQGHGRTGLFALATLLERGVVSSVEEGLAMLTAARPAIRLSRTQRRCIEMYAMDSVDQS